MASIFPQYNTFYLILLILLKFLFLSLTALHTLQLNTYPGGKNPTSTLIIRLFLRPLAMAAAAADGDDRVMATAQSIVKSLGATNADTNDMLLILSNFDNRLSSITDLIPLATSPSHTSPPLDALQHTLLRWDPPSPMGPPFPLPLPWDDSPDEAAEYLAAVDDLLAFLASDASSPEVDRADSLLQLAMARLEDELRLLLVRNTVPLDAPRLYGSIRRSSVSVPADYDFSSDAASAADEEETPRFAGGRARAPSSSSSLSFDFGGVDLVRPESVADLREIADRMLQAGYEKECCQAYSAVRRDALDECLAILGVDRLGIDEVQKIERSALDDKMKKWVQAVKIVVRVLIAGEWRLCEQIFGGSRPVAEICFAETAKGCLMQVLTFADAIAVGHRSSEKLFRILDMYEALDNLIPELQELFPKGENGGELVCSETRSILSGLGRAAKGTFVEFENAVRKEASRKPMQGGEIHPLTRYVMNYVKLLVEYSAILDSILDAPETDVVTGEDDDLNYLNGISRVGRRLLMVIESLESNIKEKSKHYEDSAMQYVFLMNNLLYIVNKVRDSELGTLLGDHWVRRRRGQVRQHATSYLRGSWSKVLACLKDEGLSVGGSSSNVSKVALKERFKNFNLGLEEIHRTQTTWKVPDPQLREELRLSVSDKVIPAYRYFLGRFGYHLETGKHAAKYIKYTPEDLEVLLLELFEGSPGPLNHPRRKLST